MRTGYWDKHHVRRLSVCAMLLAAALMISYAESLLPRFVPLPGIKPGFANIAVMAAFCISPGCAATVSAARVLIFALLFGSPISFGMSAAGALLSYICLFVIWLIKPRHLSWIGVSVLSALCHVTGQLICAVFLTGSTSALYYFPPLAVSGVICGALCGVLMNLVCHVIFEYATHTLHKNQ